MDRIVFRNEENGYTVFALETKDGTLTCVGAVQQVDEGESLEVTGEYVTHPVYGLQMKVQSFTDVPPADSEAMERYLGSGAIRGIKTALAKRIVEAFGEDTLRIMEEEPERLAQIRGISMKKAREIGQQMEEKKDLRRAMLFLQQYGVSMNMAGRIYRFYQDKVYQIIEQNPYDLAWNIDGLGFKTADEIARRVGIEKESPFRIQCGICYLLNMASAEGHTYLPRQQLSDAVSQMLEIDITQEEMTDYLMDLSIQRRIVMKQMESELRIYAERMYHMELSVAQMLKDLALEYKEEGTKLKERLAQVEAEGGFTLDALQRSAVEEAVKNGLFVMTGGPGTGKTTTIRAMLCYFEKEKMDVLLAAPTGRAAKRMTETTGWEAQTIHRLLEVSGGAQGGGFGRNRDNPLEADVIIIDEMSMVDLPLMYALLSAVVPGTRLILVGDVNQLPSVGPGAVLKDIITSDRFPVVTLTTIFRQSGNSHIVTNAHHINRGEPVDVHVESSDFFFIEKRTAQSVTDFVIECVSKRIPPYVQADPLDVQVMTPTRKGLLGVVSLNQVLQEALNPPSANKPEKETESGVFRLGDKVMQIKNNYEMKWVVRSGRGLVIDQGSGVFNGDTGQIVSIVHFSQTMDVRFDDGRVVTYPFDMLEELELAYAITVHKSQGSEYPAVIIPLLSGPRQLYNRNLLYTAVTRAKKCIVMIGSERIFQEMIKNESEQKRYCGLADCIRELST